MSVLIGLDLGTSSIKAIAIQPASGCVIASSQQPTPTQHPQPGWAEHDPRALWISVCKCLADLLSRIAPHQPVALAVSSMAEAGLPLDSNYQPLYPIQAWYDRRTIPQAQSWLKHLSIEDLHTITGQTINTSYAANKWLWLVENQPAITNKTAHWLSIPDYINFLLTGKPTTDFTIASRTLLFDQRTLSWSSSLCEFAHISPACLPPAYPSGTYIGAVSYSAAQQTLLPPGLPVFLGGHDHLCASLAIGGVAPGCLIDSVGTSEAILQVLPAFLSLPGMACSGFVSYVHTAPGLFIIKGGIKLAGGAIDWLANLINTDHNASPTLASLEEQALPAIGQRVGPLWLPHFNGSGTPFNDLNSLAAVIGINRNHSAADLYRGLLESFAFWLYQNVLSIQEYTRLPSLSITTTGGGAKSNVLNQLKADLLAKPVVRVELDNSAAVGAALLAGVGSGIYPDLVSAVASLQAHKTTFLPIEEHTKFYRPIFEHAFQPLYNLLKQTNTFLNSQSV